jgi:leader peptidase (prepilin peptidase)/N-methyltransferase
VPEVGPLGADVSGLFAEGVMRTFFLAAAGVLGLIFGSFATATAYRVPREGESIATGRSKCPNCGHAISALDNIPVLSWLLLRGRCRHCRQSIAARYPLTELATALLFVAAAAKFGFSAEAFVYAGFFWALVVLTLIDLEFKLLPNKVVYPLVVATYIGFAVTSATGGDGFAPSRAFAAGLVALIAVVAVMTWPAPEPVPDAEEDEEPAPEPLKELLFGVAALAGWVTLLTLAALDGPLEGLRGAVVGGALFSGLLLAVALIGSALAGRAAMGGGDIKLAVGLGAVLGYLEAPGPVIVGIFLSFVSGGVLSIAILLMTGDRKKQIPFGPFLALGTVLGVFFGQSLLASYLGTF